MITNETIERIYNTARIEEVISDYVTLHRRGANLIGLCPFHDEKTGSFTVSPAKGIYKCFGCGKSGTVVNFVMEHENCSYAEALRTIARRYNIEVVETQMTDEEKEKQDQRESLFKVNEWANNWFQNQLWTTADGQNIGLGYFYSRKLREDIVRKFQLGYAPDKNLLYTEAQAAGYQKEFLIQTGLCGESEKNDRLYDRFRDRVIFPIHNVSGKIVGFAGRILKQKEHVGKYVNSPESIIYSKSNELYGLFFAKQSIAKQQCCYLVEGQMDVISMHQAGIENVVSSGGTALTSQQIRLLHRFTNNVTILYDGDSAGIHAALRGIDMFLAQGLNIKVVLLPDGEDPDSFAHKMNASEFIEFIQSHQQDFIRFKADLLMHDVENDPNRLSAVIKDVVTSISVIPDHISREVYIKDCSQLMGMPVDVLHKEVDELNRQRYYETQRTKKNQVTNNPTEPSAEQDSTIAAMPSKASESEQLQMRLGNNQRNLLQIIVKYGEKPLYAMPDGQLLSVGAYILQDLQSEGIDFHENPVYARMLTEYSKHLSDTEFVAERFFKFNADPEISALASDLIAERYQLSKIHGKKSISENIQVEEKNVGEEDKLPEIVPHLLNELKLTIITIEILKTKQAMTELQQSSDIAAITQLMRNLQEQKDIQQLLCKALGITYL